MQLTWDLTPLYPSFESDAFQNDFKNLKNSLSAFKERFTFTAVTEPKSELLAYVAALNEVVTFSMLLSGYASLTFEANTSDETAMRYMDQLDMLLTELTEPSIKCQRFLTTLTNLDEILESNALLKEHAFMLKELVAQAKYMLSDQEEILLALLQNTGSNAWGTLQSKLTSGLMITLDVAGETKTLPLAAVRNLAEHDSAEVRKSAYEAELKAYAQIDEAVAFSLNSIKGEVITVAKLRGFASPLEQSALSSRLDTATIEAMISAIKDKLPAFRKYLKRKGQILGHKNGLPFYDMFAPVTDSSLKFTYEEAAAFVIKHFGSFSQELSDYAKEAFEGNWIDVEPRQGKVGGAFCSGVYPLKQSRILTNFTGSLGDVSTLAHELGHGYHNSQVFCESALNSDYPMPLAETASIFCETIITAAALKEVSDDDKVYILEKSIEGSTQVIVDILSRFLFEASIFESRKQAPLSINEIKALMIAAQKEAYGDGLDENCLHPYMWLCKPHYYSAQFNYYNYPYAFGLLFGKGLYAQYLNGYENFQEAYNKLLNNTTKMMAKDVAATMNIDITQKDFWLASLEIVEKEIEEFVRLTEHLVR